uniref:Uncharacterized protein n=1 Tax=Ananas comosus var. bracteatus TaxID=296719 RepID=A0A6V7QCG4_ANACO|nr:unnamed protein product [Ananas comosus var. bracteatus]
MGGIFAAPTLREAELKSSELAMSKMHPTANDATEPERHEPSESNEVQELKEQLTTLIGVVERQANVTLLQAEALRRQDEGIRRRVRAPLSRVSGLLLAGLSLVIVPTLGRVEIPCQRHDAVEIFVPWTIASMPLCSFVHACGGRAPKPRVPEWLELRFHVRDMMLL